MTQTLEDVDRILRIVRSAHSLTSAPKAVTSPTMQDAIFAQLILDCAPDESGFRKCIGRNAALIRWSEHMSDEALTYILWLHRH